MNGYTAVILSSFTAPINLSYKPFIKSRHVGTLYCIVKSDCSIRMTYRSVSVIAGNFGHISSRSLRIYHWKTEKS